MAPRKTTAPVKPADAPRSLKDHPFYGITLDEEQTVFRDAIWDKDTDVVFCDAKAGTGKTLVAVATANLLVKYGRFDGIVYIVSNYGEEKQGYLPGSITQKSEVYFEPLYQALLKIDEDPNRVIADESMANQKTGDCYVTALTHTFLRGTNFENKVVILDEAQNYDTESLKKTLTRIADSCCVVVIGHDKQCDLGKDSWKSGFVGYMEYFRRHDRCKVCELHTNHRGWISSYADDYGSSGIQRVPQPLRATAAAE